MHYYSEGDSSIQTAKGRFRIPRKIFSDLLGKSNQTILEPWKNMDIRVKGYQETRIFEFQTEIKSQSLGSVVIFASFKPPGLREDSYKLILVDK